jgi:streptogramin lyase
VSLGRRLHRLESIGLGIVTIIVCLVATAGSASASPLGEIGEWSVAGNPRCVVVGPDGNAWVTRIEGAEQPAIGRITPAGALTVFEEGLTNDHDMKVSVPWCLVERSDGNLWFNDLAEYGAEAIGKITMAGEITEYKAGFGLGTVWENLGRDDTLWFHESDLGIGRIALDGTVENFTANLPAGFDPEGVIPGLHEDAYIIENNGIITVAYVSSTGAITEIPTTRSTRAMVIGTDDNLWVTSEGTFTKAPAIERIEPDGTVTEFEAGLGPNSDPGAIVAGPEESMWFADPGSPAIGQITHSGAIAEYSEGLNAGAAPTEIVAGPEGDIWFTDNGTTPAIGHVSPSGEITEYDAGLNAGAEPKALTVGVEGNLWFFDEGTTRAVGRITPAGAIDEWSEGLDPTAKARGLAVGPGGNVWFINHLEEGTEHSLVRVGTEEETPSVPGGGGGGQEQPPHGGDADGGHGGTPASGGGDQGHGGEPPHGRPLSCRKGLRRTRVHGKVRCVAPKRHSDRRRHRHRSHRADRRAGKH